MHCLGGQDKVSWIHQGFLTIGALLHNIHQVSGVQRDLMLGGFVIVADGPVGVQNDGASDLCGNKQELMISQ